MRMRSQRHRVSFSLNCVASTCDLIPTFLVGATAYYMPADELPGSKFLNHTGRYLPSVSKKLCIRNRRPVLKFVLPSVSADKFLSTWVQNTSYLSHSEHNTTRHDMRNRSEHWNSFQIFRIVSWVQFQATAFPHFSPQKISLPMYVASKGIFPLCQFPLCQTIDQACHSVAIELGGGWAMVKSIPTLSIPTLSIPTLEAST